MSISFLYYSRDKKKKKKNYPGKSNSKGERAYFPQNSRSISAGKVRQEPESANHFSQEQKKEYVHVGLLLSLLSTPL